MLTLSDEERAAADDKSACSQLAQLGKGGFEVGLAAGVEHVDLQPQIASSRTHIPYGCVGAVGICRINEQCDDVL